MRLQRATWYVAFAAFVLVVSGVWGYTTYRDRAADIALAEQRLSALVLIVSQHAERSIEAGDNVVTALVELASGVDVRNDGDVRELHNRMQRLIAGSPQIGSVWVLDERGRTLADSWGHPPQSQGDFSDRPYFQAHLEPDAGLFLGASSPGAITTMQRFTLSRRIDRGEDGFAGVAVAGIKSDYFEKVYEQAGLGPQSHFLFRDTRVGALLAQWPLDGVDQDAARLTVIGQVRGYPAEVQISQPVRGVLAEWRSRTLQTGLLALASIFAFGGLTFLGLQASDRVSQSRAALEVANLTLEKRVNERTALLAEREARLRVLIDSLTEYAVLTLDRNGAITSWNSGAERILGYSEPEVLGQSSALFLTPEDVAAGVVESELAVAAAEGSAVDERWHVRKDGSRFWASGLMVPLLNDPQQGFVKIFRDLTARKQAEERMQMLMNELNHRVKNTLTTVQATVAQTLQGSDVATEVRDALEARLISLAKSHDLLTRANQQGASLSDVARQALEAFLRQSDGENRFRIEGPHVWLRPRIALSLSMALHELATNAMKYGAFSTPQGRVTLRWETRTDAAGTAMALRIVWEERDGPPVRKPERKGFGSRLIERALARELNGQVRLEYDPAGVVCVIEMPLDGEEDQHGG